MEEKRKKKNVFYTAFKIVIGLGIIIFLVNRTDLKTMEKVIRSVNGWYLSLAVFFLIIEIILTTARLRVSLLLKNITVPFFALLKLNLISTFVGRFLPSRLGIDALRVFYISKYTQRGIHSFASVALDRVINTFIITIFATGSFFIGGYFRSHHDLLMAIVPMWIGVCFIFLFMSKKLRSRIGGFFKRIKPLTKLVIQIGNLANSFYEFQSRFKYLATLGILCVGFQCVRITASYMFARSLNIEVPYVFYFLFMPILLVLGMLPFSVGGIGLVQGGTVYLFVSMGIDTESAFGFSILVYVISLIFTLPGLYFFYREGFDSLVQSVSRNKFFPTTRRK